MSNRNHLFFQVFTLPPLLVRKPAQRRGVSRRSLQAATPWPRDSKWARRSKLGERKRGSCWRHMVVGGVKKSQHTLNTNNIQSSFKVLSMLLNNHHHHHLKRRPGLIVSPKQGNKSERCYANHATYWWGPFFPMLSEGKHVKERWEHSTDLRLPTAQKEKLTFRIVLAAVWLFFIHTGEFGGEVASGVSVGSDSGLGGVSGSCGSALGKFSCLCLFSSNNKRRRSSWVQTRNTEHYQHLKYRRVTHVKVQMCGE